MIDKLTEIDVLDEDTQGFGSQPVREELSESGGFAGVEADYADELIEPFDPDLISITQRVVPMDTLLRRLKQGSIRLSPNFQRKEVWDNGRRSRLIESIILRIPLPMFYVSEDVDGRWDVVDGLQRLSTIRNFILGDEKKEKLRLENLEFLGGRLSGKTFDDIDTDNPAYQRMINTILETEMRFTLINPGTPEEVKRNIFKRLNTGGMPLSSQEIRHALYQGQVTDLLATLAESGVFRAATGNSINDSRMVARELVLYFLAFAVFPHSVYKGNMDKWLSNAMRVINLMPNLEQSKLLKIFGSQEDIPDIQVRTIEELTNRFELAMTRGLALFEKHAFRKSLLDERRAPVNKALFETWGNILSCLSQEDFQFLFNNKEKLMRTYNILLNGDEELGALLTEPYGLLLGFVKKDHGGDISDREEKYLVLKELAFFIFGADISHVSLERLSYAVFLDDDGTLDEFATKLYNDLLQGKMGESLYISISRNASEVESVKRRYGYFDNLVKNIITYAKQEQAA